MIGLLQKKLVFKRSTVNTINFAYLLRYKYDFLLFYIRYLITGRVGWVLSRCPTTAAPKHWRHLVANIKV